MLPKYHRTEVPYTLDFGHIELLFEIRPLLKTFQNLHLFEIGDKK